MAFASVCLQWKACRDFQITIKWSSGGTCVCGHSSVLPVLKEISVWWGWLGFFSLTFRGKGAFTAAHILLLQVSWASVLEATLLERGDGIQSARWEIQLMVLQALNVNCCQNSEVLNRIHLKDALLRQRSSKAGTELVSQLQCYMCSKLGKF